MVNTARKHWGLVLFTALATAAGIAFTQAPARTPVVSLPSVPLYVNGSKAKANLTLALSVETPTVGSAYTSSANAPNEFDPDRKYIGYHDPMVCYVNVSAHDITGGEYFAYSSAKASIGAACPSGESFDGNFLNWATTSAIDVMRYGLTGGHRVFDEGTGAGRTVLERAYLPDELYGHSFFPVKKLPTDQISLRTPFASGVLANGLYIYNCRNRVYFAGREDSGTSCASPFRIANAQSPSLVKTTGDTTGGRFYQTRVLVCDPATAANRLMLQSRETGRWSGLCLPYQSDSGSGYFKPVGQFQVNADNVRVSVFSYLNDDDLARYGGVMRAPLKYLGPRQYDANFNLMDAENPYREWDPVTGVLLRNPQEGHADYGDQGYGQSGAINYINGFGTLNPDALGRYKGNDPVSELYYESFRYLQGQQPTSLAFSGITGTPATDRALTENFPAYSTWKDPFEGFTDNPGQGRSCMRNSVLAVADVFTHGDRYVPGNTVERHDDLPRSADTSPVALNVERWTQIVGSFEANKELEYTDSNGKPQNASAIEANQPYRSDLPNIATDEFTQTNARGSFLMAGLAYFANTQSFRTDLPKARISTFAIDVNAYNRTGSDTGLRRGTQLYLAAKYGGFDDHATGNTGNPYASGNNLAWQGGNGDAKNYFVADDPQKFLDSIADVFSSLVSETSSIAGGALSSQELQSAAEGAVFQGGFNPVANDWSGKVRKFALELSEDQTSTTVASAPTWDAAEQLTLRTQTDHGASRNIVVGSPLGLQGTVAPSSFSWNDQLADAHKTALNKTPAGAADTLGDGRVNYLRGDRRLEQSPSDPLQPFRPRQLVLGSVVNAGLVYQGAPTSALSGAGYAAFREDQLSRSPVVFANANDGMLHAFRASDGSEAFAYIPGFIVPQLNLLPERSYTHRPLLDATPTVAEARIGEQWRSVLVSGAGAGAQGVYALDVTDPETFSKDNVLWEFTDADHPAIGNVLGKPRIVRVRMNDSGSATDTFKWMAVVPGGVNNYRNDTHSNSSTNPSIFLIDMAARPSTADPWEEGVNFWRVELPSANNSTAPGVVQITTVQTHGSGNLDAIVAGDLHGNVWKLSFRKKGVSSLGTDGLANLALLNAMGANQNPFFIALSSTEKRQPITTAPVIGTGFGGQRLILVGTGKFLENADNSVPTSPPASFYALLDGASPIAGRSNLQGATIEDDDTVSAPSFTFGTADGQKQGWYIDLPSETGERQVSDALLDRGRLVFTTIKPTGGACGEGGGRTFEIDMLTGQGTSWESAVGLLGGPMLLGQGKPAISDSSTSGRRTATYRMSVLTQGSKGTTTDSSKLTFTLQVGRMTWRQVHNHRDLVP